MAEGARPQSSSASSTAKEPQRSERPRSTSPKAPSPVKDTASSGKPKQSPPEHASNTDNGNPKKRRKVNHACVYCRRSHMTCDAERPCTRCIKRNIGHLCHDEPRETPKKAKNEIEPTAVDEATTPKKELGTTQSMPGVLREATASLTQGNSIQPSPSTNDIEATSSMAPGANGSVANQNLDGLGYNGLGFASSQLHDMHRFHPNYMFNAPEVSTEYNLLNEFLNSSLCEDGSMFNGEEFQGIYNDPSIFNSMTASFGGSNGQPYTNYQLSQSMAQSQSTSTAPSLPRSTNTLSPEKAREAYYMTAADPSGTEAPEERINKLLKAKYDAGLLKPFNYVRGYARLNQYMEKHMRPQSRQKILRHLDKFRPKFRERMQKLTDIELVLVEMWFERSLMEYDRIFASMAIPACCWRRTGEIFRGNKEMAELIGVPIEHFRDGKLAIHEIIVEDSLVDYWEKFSNIAFDNTQKAMLTKCAVKSAKREMKDQLIECCFSLTIKRDNFNIPSLIVGNFLPV